MFININPGLPNTMKKIMMVSLLAMSVLSATAHAEEGGEDPKPMAPSTGVVKFEGTVVESPCFISLDTAEQTVSLGDVAKSQLDTAGQTSSPKPFQIKLQKCDASDGKKFTIAFNASTDGTDGSELSVAEADRGVAIGIRDKVGGEVDFKGTASEAIEMIDDENILEFTAYAKKASDADSVTPGAFTAQTNFQIDYK
jgi:type 1 fimbria pilin